MELSIEEFTPQQARQILSKQPKNRKLKAAKCAEIAAQITGGEWTLNGETIKFNKSGSLRDGQNRLMAVILANNPIRTAVAREIDDKAFESVDTGTKRTEGDRLELKGYKNANKLASMVKIIWQLENRLCVGGSGPLTHKAGEAIIRKYDLQGQIDPSFDQFPYGSKINGLFAVFNHIDSEASDAFKAAVILGENLSVDHPAMALRRQILFAASSNMARVKMILTAIVAYVIKGWNAYYTGASVKRLVYRGGEPCPHIEGSNFPDVPREDLYLNAAGRAKKAFERGQIVNWNA